MPHTADEHLCRYCGGTADGMIDRPGRLVPACHGCAAKMGATVIPEG